MLEEAQERHRWREVEWKESYCQHSKGRCKNDEKAVRLNGNWKAKEKIQNL